MSEKTMSRMAETTRGERCWCGRTDILSDSELGWLCPEHFPIADQLATERAAREAAEKERNRYAMSAVEEFRLRKEFEGDAKSLLERAETAEAENTKLRKAMVLAEHKIDQCMNFNQDDPQRIRLGIALHALRAALLPAQEGQNGTS